MTVQILFKRNDWVFHTGPWLRPFVSWQTNPNCLDILNLEFSVIWVHSPFLPGKKQIFRLLLVHCNLAIWRWFPWFWRLSFEMLMILVQWILRKNLNRLLQYHLFFWCFASNSAFFKWHMSISEAKWTFAPDVLASSITCFLPHRYSNNHRCVSLA